MTDFVAIGSVFIDDIVQPDGRTLMGILGGGAVHGAAGMAVWDTRPGVSVRVGEGIPQDIVEQLARDFDTAGLSPVDLPQARAWQVFEHDGRRRELLRVDIIKPFCDGPAPDKLPEEWREAAGLHMVLDGENFFKWRVQYPQKTILWEPNQPYMVRENAAEFKRLIQHADILSPNLAEAREIYGFLAPESLVGEMLAGGAKVVALRMGEQGSLVATRVQPRPIHIPAVPCDRIVDVTGAGNSYCGAFLVGYVRTGDAIQSARLGAVSASFCLEQIGIIDLHRANLVAGRDVRLAWIEAQP